MPVTGGVGTSWAMAVSPEIIVEAFPVKLIAATLTGVLGVLAAGLSFAAKWLIKQDNKREVRLEALEKAVLALDRAVDGRATKEALSNAHDRLRTQLDASEAAQNRQHTELATKVAVMAAVAEERKQRG